MFKFQRFVDKITSAHLIRIFLIFAVLATTINLFLYLLTDYLIEDALTEQMLHRETVLVRAGAKTIEEFLKSQENEVLFLASLPSLADPLEQDVSLVLKERLKHVFSPVVDIIRVDAKGEVVARGSQISGASNVADRDYFLWAKEKAHKGQFFYSKVVIARGGPAKGEKALALAAPVYRGDKFSGLVAVVVSVPELAKTYVFPLAVTERSITFLVLEEGTLVTSSKDVPKIRKIEEMVDLYAGDSKNTRLVLEKIKKGEDGKTTLVFNEPPLGQTTRLVVFTPVKLTEKVVWSLVTSVPKQETFVFFGPFGLQQTRELIFGLTTIVVVAILFVFGIKVVERRSFLEGFAEGRDHTANGDKKI